MVYSDKLQQAINFSIRTHEVHQKQKRKGKDIPYIIHPLSVGIVLASAHAEEDIVVAGILHDTIEDSIKEKKVTRDALKELFGGKVALLVDSVTEEYLPGMTWREKKMRALEKIKNFSVDSALLKSADVIANVREIDADYKEVGESVFERFGAPKGTVLTHYQKVAEELLKYFPENTLRTDLEDLLGVIERMKD